MKKEEMKAEVLKFIREKEHVSYVEIEELFEQNHYAYKGEIMACADQCEHVVFWSDWSAEAFDILRELLHEGLIHREPTIFLTYLVDGGGMELPQAKKLTQYKTDHWLPVVFMSGPERDAYEG